MCRLLDRVKVLLVSRSSGLGWWSEAVARAWFVDDIIFEGHGI